MTKQRVPLTDSIIIAVSKLVDDSQTERRDPSHSDLEFQIKRAGLSAADPAKQGPPVGKAKRIRRILDWAMENDLVRGEELVAAIISTVRGCGGFRSSSQNYVGRDNIANAIAAFKDEGFVLGEDGLLTPATLDSLEGVELTAALAAYARRAKRGAYDAALLVGTGKDLLEATAKHVIVERLGRHPPLMDFPTLLGQAFHILDLASSLDKPQPDEPPRRRLQGALFETGKAVNALRNKEGTGHGRPWLPTVTEAEAKVAIEAMGIVSAYLLKCLKPNLQI